MVLFSILQALWGRPLTRAVFRFGPRTLRSRIIMEEIIMGSFMVLPWAMILAQITMRLAMAGWRPRMARSDWWTTLLITLVGDLILELLLPSLQCLPMPYSPPATTAGASVDAASVITDWLSAAVMGRRSDTAPGGDEGPVDLSYGQWWLQTWGWACPTPVPPARLLTPEAVGTLLSLRLFFVGLGVYLGETFVPVALTGGIACGKSTVAQLLSRKPNHHHHHMLSTSSSSSTANNNNQQADTARSPNSPRTKGGSKKKKGPAGEGSSSEALTGLSRFWHDPHPSSRDEEDEGSFLIIDTDNIAHEILLPPAVLAGETNLVPSEEVAKFTVQPHESVYPLILETFADDQGDHGHILDEQGFIDRRKLGALIFREPALRRTLNGLTHPRILLIMLKRILYGLFLTREDVVCADVPLLLESGQLRRLFGLTLVVACDPDLQFQRLRQRNPDLSEQQCRERIASQMSMDRKVKLADIVIWNNGDLDQLAEEVERVRREVMGRIYGVGMSLLQMLMLVGGSLSLAVSSKLFSSWSN